MRTLKAKLSFLLVFLFAFTFFVGFRSMAAGNAVEEAKAALDELRSLENELYELEDELREVKWIMKS